MSTTTLNYTGKLVTTNCWCGVWHAVPKELYDHMLAQHNDGRQQTGIYCPLGHSWTFGGKGEAARLREEKERLERVAASRQESLRIVREERDRAEKSAHAYKMVAAKARKRAQAAVCPVDGCGRSFVQIRRHLAAKHPEFVGPLPEPDSARYPSNDKDAE